MISDAATVDEYLNGLTDDRRAALSGLRAMIAGIAPDATELMKYGHPHWELDGSLFALASQKHHMALYVAEKRVLAGFKTRLEPIRGIDAGVGCIRFRRADRLPRDVVRELLEAAATRRRERRRGA